MDKFPIGYYDKIILDIPPFTLANASSSSTTTSSSTSIIGTSTSVPASNIDLASVTKQVNDLIDGPLIVPTFDQYVTAAQFLTNTIGKSNVAAVLTQTGASYAALVDFVPEIHFAPNTTLTQSLVQYLETHTTTFSQLAVVVHNSEEEAVNELVVEGIPWALIVVNEASSSGVAVDIRMNYQYLPNTNQIIDPTAVGLDTAYQSYFFSGFLTIERTIDAWAWDLTGAAASSNPQCTLPTVIMTPFPTIAYDVNEFYGAVGFLLGLAFTSNHAFGVHLHRSI